MPTRSVSPVRRTRGRVALAVVYALLALNAWAQVVLIPFGLSDDPAALTAMQALVGACGAAAAWGCWTGSRRAPVAAALHGIVTAAMLASLVPLLDLGPEARGGLWTSAAAVLLFGLWAAWYLRRSVRASESVSPSGRA